MQRTKLELIQQWIIKADHDLGTAQITFKHIPKYKDTISFHCQQAVEKYLKAYLVFLDIKFPNTHSLSLLLDIIQQKEEISGKYYSMAESLQAFAVEVKYPSGRYKQESFDIEQSIEFAQTFRKDILNKMEMLDFKED